MFSFLGSPALTLAYYLFVLFSIEAALVLAWWQWRRLDTFRAHRLTIVFASLTIIRLMLFVLAGFGNSSPEFAQIWLPPFERVVAITSLGFLVWGFTPYFRENQFTGNVLLGINTVFAFIFFGLAVFSPWTGEDFNQTGWESFFIAWQILLVVFGTINCGMQMDDERMFALFSFGTLLAGYVLHIVFGANYLQPNNPFWVRLAELIAYPMFTVAVYHGALQSLNIRSQEFQNLSEVSLSQINGLVNLFEATSSISSTLELSHVLDGAAESVASALEADQCAIGLPENENDLSQLRLVSIFNPIRKGRGESVAFPVNDQQVIKHALRRKNPVVIENYRDNSQIRMLFTLMGAPDTGPLLVCPILQDEEKSIGVLIVGNAGSKHYFSETEIELCKALAGRIAVAINHAKEYAAVLAKSQHLSWTLRNQELESGKRLAAMESELRKSREEVTLFAQRMHEYEEEQKRLEDAISRYRERVKGLAKENDTMRVSVDDLRHKERLLVEIANQFKIQKQRLEKVEVERQALQVKVEDFEQSAEETEQLNEALATSHARARKLARALKRARTQLGHTAPVPAALSSAETSAELEDLSCGVIITDGNFNINRVNAVASIMLGKTNRQLVGSRLCLLYTSDAADDN